MAAVPHKPRERSYHSCTQVGGTSTAASHYGMFPAHNWPACWAPPTPAPFYCTRCLAHLESLKGHCDRCGSTRIALGPVPAVLNSEGPPPLRDYPLPKRAASAPQGRRRKARGRRKPAGANRRRKRAVA